MSDFDRVFEKLQCGQEKKPQEGALYHCGFQEYVRLWETPRSCEGKYVKAQGLL